MTWWIKQSGRIEGPISEDELLKRIRLNVVRSLDRVSDDGRTWRFLRDVNLWRSTGRVPADGGLVPDTHGADEAVVMQNSSSSETEARNSAATSAGPQLWSKRRLIAIATSCAVVAVVLCAFVAWMVHAARDEMVRREQADKAHKAAEAERKAKEEQARVEQAAAEQKAHEEAERKEREEKDRLEKEAKEKRDREDAANRPSLSSKDIKDRIAIIECKEGSGTGFLLEMEGKTYLVSNEHVLRSSSAPKATMPNGEQLSLGEFSVATDRDLARFEVLGCNVKPLVATDDEPNANDVVTVCGNSLGGGGRNREQRFHPRGWTSKTRDECRDCSRKQRKPTCFKRWLCRWCRNFD